MICISISDGDKQRVIERLKGVDFAEVRLDALSPTAEEVAEIFSQPTSLIATMRPGGCSDEERLRLLATAIKAGADFVDIELDSPTVVREGVMAEARRNSCEVVVSYHDYEGTPERKELMDIVDRCFAAGADIAKIACMAKSPADAARILGILDGERKIVAIGMGRAGMITRIAAPLLGSPFTFASQGEGKATAEGQMDAENMRRILEEIENARS